MSNRVNIQEFIDKANADPKVFSATSTEIREEIIGELKKLQDAGQVEVSPKKIQQFVDIAYSKRYNF